MKSKKNPESDITQTLGINQGSGLGKLKRWLLVAALIFVAVTAMIIWTLQDGQLVAIAVTTGATDGIMTEVTGGDVGPGTAIVVDIVSANR